MPPYNKEPEHNMNAELNIDNYINYESEYRQYIKKAVVTGDQLIGLCPFHDDKNNSFSVDLKTGKWHCFAEDIGGNFVKFYSLINNIDTKEAYKQILQRYNISEPEPPKEKKKSTLKSFSVSEYALAKRLPEDWLKKVCCIETRKDRSGTSFVYIPYFDTNKAEVVSRKRYGAKEFRWSKGSAKKIPLYGLWQEEQVRSSGYVILVEGESDTQSLWFIGLSAYGVPGASMFKPEMVKDILGLKVYIHVEPDQGGQTFSNKVLAGLRETDFQGDVFTFSCNDAGVKDPSDLYLRDGKDKAAETLKKLLTQATPIDINSYGIENIEDNAPIALRTPENFEMSANGIIEINKKTFDRTLISRTPILLTKRLKSIETGEEKIEVAFLRDHKWRKVVFPRSVIFTARGITALADLGCTVTSENAKALVRFLSALEAENIDIIRAEASTSTFGWQPGGEFIPGHEDGLTVDIDQNAKPMADAYCQTGSMRDWISTMSPHRTRTKFRFMLSASFAAPLLRIVRQRIFMVYNWGGSKGGKTAALKAALSVWGDPERLMVNFNATQVGLERTAALYCDLPLGIDERQLAGNNQQSLEKIVYMLSQGVGKIRGAKAGGIQATQTWRTVAIATGEEPLSTDTSQTGVSSRVLELYGGPFEDEESASKMHQDASKDYGIAGPEFIEKIKSMKESDIVRTYDHIVSDLQTHADGRSRSHIAGIAIVTLADAMIDSWFFTSGGTPSKLLPEITEESLSKAMSMAIQIIEEQMTAEAGDVNENAIQYIVDWIMSNSDNFTSKAVGQCFGTIDDKDGFAYIFPTVLNGVLDRGGYSPRKTLRYMSDNNIIKGDKAANKTRFSVVKKFNGKSCRLVAFDLRRYTTDPTDEKPDNDWISTDPEDGFDQAELPFD